MNDAEREAVRAWCEITGRPEPVSTHCGDEGGSAGGYGLIVWISPVHDWWGGWVYVHGNIFDRTLTHPTPAAAADALIAAATAAS
jgi:hypothetical protein